MDRFFYHSFPRPRAGRDMASAGLAILESICRHGLLLVPESVPWRDPSGTRPGDSVYALQRRICFTELAPQELPEHAEHFGPFAIEYDVGVLRGFGALPVFYIPNSTEADGPMSWAGTSLIARLADALQIMTALAQTEHLSRGKPPGETLDLDLTLRDGGVHKRTFRGRDMRVLQDYLAFLSGGPGMPFHEIAGALRAMSSLFYPTENSLYTGPLTYYRQREWRLITGSTIGGRSTTEIATSAQQDELLQIDRDFFSRRLLFGDGEHTLAEKSHFLRDVNGTHVLARAHRCIVPRAVMADAIALLDRYDLQLPLLALEELA